MIEQAFIHEYGQGKMEPEHEQVKNVLEQRNIPVRLFTTKVLNRSQLKLTSKALVVGEHPIFLRALKFFNIQAYSSDCYPTSIRPFLKRKIWQSVENIQILNCIRSAGLLDWCNHG